MNTLGVVEGPVVLPRPPLAVGIGLSVRVLQIARGPTEFANLGCPTQQDHKPCKPDTIVRVPLAPPVFLNILVRVAGETLGFTRRRRARSNTQEESNKSHHVLHSESDAAQSSCATEIWAGDRNLLLRATYINENNPSHNYMFEKQSCCYLTSRTHQQTNNLASHVRLCTANSPTNS